MKIKIEGLKQLDRALGELSKAQAKSTSKRVLKMVANDISDAAQGLAPRKTGRLKNSIGATFKAPSNFDVGSIAYGKTMKSSGGDAKASVAAMRSARRANPSTFAQIFIGPGGSGKNRSLQAFFQEFGTVNHGPKPYMRPAFEAKKNQVLQMIFSSIGNEIQKTRKRVAVRAAKKAARI